MNIHKINKLLQALSSDERKQFAKNLKKDVAPYYLFKYLTTKSEKDIANKNKMLRSVIRTDPQDHDKAFSKATSDLYKLLKAWLIQQELEADKLTRNQLLANAFKRYKQTDAYFETLKDREQLVEAQTARDSAYHWEWMRLSHARYFHPQTDFQSDVAEDNFTKTVDHLDDFYLLTRLRYIAERNMRNYNFHLNKALSKQEAMLRPTYKDKPLARLCMLAANLIKSPDNEVFRTEFCPLLEQYIHLADAENQGTLATYRINYTSRQTQDGQADFMRDQFEAYQFAIKNGYLENEGYLDETHFLNAVTGAAVLHEFEAAEKLISEANTRLKENHENIKELADSYVHFYKSSYAEAYKLFEKDESLTVLFPNTQTSLRARSLKAQCMYELILQDHNIDTNDLIQHLDAYQRFLKRHSGFSKKTRQSNLNFINLLKKMANKPKKEARKLLEDFLKTDKPIILKTWLSDGQ